MALRLDDNGKLDLALVHELEPDALSDWIWNRLHNTDTLVPDDPRQHIGQYFLIGAIYKDLQPGTQENVRRILERFLRQLAGGHDDWQGEPAHHLLLLVRKLREPSLAAPVRRMAEQASFKHGDEDLYARLVQVLVSLGEKMTPDFWEQLVERDAERYVALAFSGMLRHSLDQALGLLVPLDLTDEMQGKLDAPLRGLLASKRYNRDDLRKILSDMQAVLSEDTSAFIARTLPELELEAVAEPEQDRYVEHRAVLGEQGYKPERQTLCLAA
jgi:hypothetical protein